MIDILLVEDNKELSQLMSKFIVKQGYSIYCAESGEKALEYMKENDVRLMLLDIMLPGIDGFAVCTRVREKQNIPIIILSARVDKNDKINGFALGADDYVEKPVDIDILCAKITALFRRYYGVDERASVVESGDVRIDQDRMEVYFKGEKLNLTIKEYDLLVLLVENSGKTLSKEYLFANIWGMESDSDYHTLTVHIKMLRDKLEEDKKHPTRIVTVWGVGYRYEEI